MALERLKLLQRYSGMEQPGVLAGPITQRSVVQKHVKHSKCFCLKFHLPLFSFKVVRLKWIAILLIGLVLATGCVSQVFDTTIGGDINLEEIAKEKCMILCRQAARTSDLSDGPCLSDDNPDWGIDDWVCDVAHSPRTDVDNLPENQCREFRDGEAGHFVEVDTNCNIIRAV